MDYNMIDLNMGRKPKITHSLDARSGADALRRRLESGDMGMEVLRNTFAQFSGELEEKDFVSYSDFMTSSKGKRLVHVLEEWDEGKLFEL